MTPSNETLDRLIAEKVMGWKTIPYHQFSSRFPVEAETGTDSESVALYKDKDKPTTGTKSEMIRLIYTVRPHCAPDLWSPSTDLNHCHRAEIQWGKIISQRNKRGVHCYKLELGRIKVPDDPHLISEWAIATADARTRCIAMLQAIGVELLKGEDDAK
jgi:hypothetical protein